MTQFLVSVTPLLFILLWSSGAIFVKLGLESSDVMTFLCVRATGSFCLMLIICSIQYKLRLSSFLALCYGDKIRILVVGLLLQVFYQGFFFFAIYSGLSPGMLAIVIGLQPIITPFFARENIGKIGYLWLFIGFIGLGVAIYGGKDIGLASVEGISFALISMLSITVASVLQKKITSPLVLSVLGQYLVSAVLFLIPVSIFGFNADLSFNFIISASWMVIVVSTGAILLLAFMLRQSEASQVSSFFFLVPIVTYFLDYLVYSADVSFLTLIGGLTVTIAVWAFYRLRRQIIS